MEYFVFAIVMLVLIALVILLSRVDTRINNKHKKDAYRLLETPDPYPKEVKDTIKGLRLYSGRIKKDKESAQLIERLHEKHGHLIQ